MINTWVICSSSEGEGPHTMCRLWGFSALVVSPSLNRWSRNKPLSATALCWSLFIPAKCLFTLRLQRTCPSHSPSSQPLSKVILRDGVLLGFYLLSKSRLWQCDFLSVSQGLFLSGPNLFQQIKNAGFQNNHFWYRCRAYFGSEICTSNTAF